MANFVNATITGNSNFESTTFHGNANFRSTTFTNTAKFDMATIPNRRYTGNGTSESWTSVEGARFERGMPPELTTFLSTPDEAVGIPAKTE
jgi:hypothetical protein